MSVGRVGIVELELFDRRRRVLTGPCRCVSGCRCGPSSGGPDGAVVGNAEGVESGKVDCGCSSNEIGEDSFQAPGAGFSSAMNLAGEMTDFSFDFRSLRPVLGTPLRGLLIQFRF